MSSHPASGPSGPGTPSSSASTPTGSNTPIGTSSSQPPPPPSTTTPGTPGPKRRKNAAAHASLPKPKKPKLHRNLDSITARKELPNVPAVGGIGKSGQRMVKGPYKKREKKEKPDAAGKKGASASGSAAAAGAGKGGRKAGATAQGSKSGDSTRDAATHGGAVGGANEAGATGGGENEPRLDGPGEGEGDDEGKEDDDDDHEEEPEYSELEWNQEANTRGRSKDELKALLDCFSEDQLKRYEVYRRSGLSRPTVKKLVGTILNQQVTQTMTFVVAGFCKVYVGEMVEKAREVMEDWGHTGPIRPEHLREAQRISKLEEVQKGRGVQTPHGYKRRMFCR
ncbi:transcription initiation factor TFIID subunit 11 [Podila clonocystis]|nr:transcription initiation factor TFIID subunit 11 [Podila clonocystis]